MNLAFEKDPLRMYSMESFLFLDTFVFEPPQIIVCRFVFSDSNLESHGRFELNFKRLITRRCERFVLPSPIEVTICSIFSGSDPRIKFPISFAFCLVFCMIIACCCSYSYVTLVGFRVDLVADGNSDKSS